MFKVLIVDDEHIVQLALKSLIDWQGLNCEIRALCSNGLEAKEMMDKESVDLVITDINMPVMDGLALIEWINDKSPNTKLIVLSAYNDYDYVRRAFVLGVSDYILKADMDPESLAIMVRKLLSDNNLEHDSHSQDNTLTPNLETPKELVIEACIDNRYNLDEAYVRMHLSQEELSANWNCFVVLVDDFNKVVNRYDDEEIFDFIQHMVNTITGRLPKSHFHYVLVRSANVYCVVLEKKLGSQKENRCEVNGVLKGIQRALETYMDITVTIGLWDEGLSFDNLGSAYEHAERLAELRYIYGKRRIIYPEDAGFIKRVESHSIMGHMEKLNQSIKELDILKTDNELTLLLNEIATYKESSLKDLFGYYMELLISIITEFRNMENDLMNAFDHNTDFLQVMQQYETKDELHAWFRNLIQNMMTYMIDNQRDDTGYYIRQAKKYMEDHYMDNLNLAFMAEIVELSESYFSSLFVKETGESFIQYLTRIRIKKASELLKGSNLKVYQIADKVGYDNTEHFSRVFKKIMGISPNQYKNKKHQY